MRKAMLVLSLSMLGPGHRTTAGETQWRYMPLRTAAQKAKGYPGGETGQMFFCGAFSPSSPDYVAIGVDTAQTYISVNGGKSWQMRSRGILSNGVQSVAFDPRNKDILFAFGLNAFPRTPARKIIRTAEGLRGSKGHPFGGIYRSVDCGRSWKLMFRAMVLRDQAQNQYFAFDPDSFDGTRCRTIYAASHNKGLLKSTDGGETWESLGLEYKHINAVLIHPKNNRLFFIATHEGLYRSDDAGATFCIIGRGLPAGAPVSGLVLNAKNENVLYVALHKAGVWWSTDGGHTFTPRGNGLEKHEWRRLAISPVNPNILYVQAQRVTSNTSVQCSRDGGETWHPIGKWEPHMIGNHPQYGGYFAEGIIAHPTEAETALILSRIHKTTDAGRSWQHSADGVSGCRLRPSPFARTRRRRSSFSTPITAPRSRMTTAIHSPGLTRCGNFIPCLAAREPLTPCPGANASSLRSAVGLAGNSSSARITAPLGGLSSLKNRTMAASLFTVRNQ
ncbi:MAG: hypothetical protein HQ546_11730 [Planctomycetes bacterium]|nr:hypothetical protein [Planctomycetota bacterium]